MSKTIKEINEKIKRGEVVVVTAEEVIDLVEKKGIKAAAREVDVVTTGTFGPMCSSMAYLNVGHSKPRIKLGGGRVTLNNVPAYTGLAAVDICIGATAIPDDDPRNKVYPGEFKYGGGHVIEELVRGKDVVLEADAYGTDCYPKKHLKTYINLKDMNEAVLLNPRNCYQNYNIAVNVSDKRNIYTYMGVLKPNMGNATYCSAGQLSPLLKDPYYRTIGVGTRIFLGGGTGYIYWNGTQHAPAVTRKPNGVPQSPAGTLAVMGDLKQMKSSWLIGVSFEGYGATMAVGLGVPIPVLDEDILKSAAVKDEDIWAQITDYSDDYPHGRPSTLGEANYKQLKSGKITIKGKVVPTSPLSSYSKARDIAEELKKWIADKKFFLTEYVQGLPGADSGTALKGLKERPVEGE